MKAKNVLLLACAMVAASACAETYWLDTSVNYNKSPFPNALTNVNKKGIKMMVSSRTQDSPDHCTAGHGGTKVIVMEGHATLLPSIWHLEPMTHTLDQRNIKD